MQQWLAHQRLRLRQQGQPQLLLLQKTMVVAEGVGRALNPAVNMWQLAQPLIETWIAQNLGPQAQLRSAVEDGLEAARRLPHLVERAERTLEAVANGGIRLHPQSLDALAAGPGFLYDRRVLDAFERVVTAAPVG